MKATGIVRRIDDLGRVVIPKEIRRTMRIREGDPLEIYTDNDGEVIFKKYSPIGELSAFSGQFAEILSKAVSCPVIVCDRDHVISVSGMPKKEVLERRVSASLEEMMEQRKSYIYESDSQRKLQPIEGVDRYALVQYPIIAAGDVCGAIMMFSGENGGYCTEIENKLIQTAAAFLGKQLEE
ncbi:MAG: stage V sporulation protein T [Oscillospiraceae bacterium]|nr:stage V sporulation protein T [Oscillospiraceae bacterium]